MSIAGAVQFSNITRPHAKQANCWSGLCDAWVLALSWYFLLVLTIPFLTLHTIRGRILTLQQLGRLGTTIICLEALRKRQVHEVMQLRRANICKTTQGGRYPGVSLLFDDKAQDKTPLTWLPDKVCWILISSLFLAPHLHSTPWANWIRDPAFQEFGILTLISEFGVGLRLLWLLCWRWDFKAGSSVTQWLVELST